MPSPAEPLSKLGFLTIGSFDGADPGPGHETTLEVIALGEQLGFDSAWCATGTCSTGSPHRSRSWPPRRNAPAGSRSAPR
jgi:alkanesulfonate monooxygenase SsuD/methylene tetrahydromethanopterin reductase-like flavin-dependent oxidoreductase (luciferase family)